jgi:CheY-like chemotaxis protein
MEACAEMRKKRVLLVDDDNLTRGYFRTLLDGAGYAVLEAVDGIEAVRLYRAEPPDLIVMDIYMPRMNGLDALLEMDPSALGTPVIALSGGGAGTGTDPLDLARSLGAARTFQKPFKYPEFLSAVRDLLEGAGAGEEE